jgi:hypothetical protein
VPDTPIKPIKNKLNNSFSIGIFPNVRSKSDKTKIKTEKETINPLSIKSKYLDGSKAKTSTNINVPINRAVVSIFSTNILNNGFMGLVKILSKPSVITKYLTINAFS